MTRTATANPARPILITSLVSALAVGLGACGSTTKAFKTNGPRDFTQEQQAKLANVQIDPAGTKGNVDQAFFETEGRASKLPDRWVGEAVSGTAEIEARRASAQSAFVTSDANFAEFTAEADADLRRSLSDRETAEAYAERMREVYEARLDESETHIFADEISNEAEFNRRETMLSASVQEWQAEVERMRSIAETDWSQALAEHENMLAQREAVLDRGNATIQQMSRTADLTEARAAERVTELRNAARNTSEQTTAQVNDLNHRIQTVREQTRATVGELSTRADTTRDRSSARIAEMLAEANALEAQNAEEKYRLKVISARVQHDNQISEAQQLRVEAQAKSERDAAEAAAKRAEADRDLQLARVMFEEAKDSIAAEFERAVASVGVTRAEADRVEREARAAFVKAEIDARVASIREEAKHNVALSNAEQKRIAAEAEAEARRSEAELRQQLAQRFLAGGVDLPGNDLTQPRGATPNDAAPSFTTAGTKPEVLEAPRVAQFRAQLAEASRIRQQAEADQNNATASRDERIAEFVAWFDNKEGENDAWHSRIDAWQTSADTKTDEVFARSEALIAAAGADRDRNEVDAESLKRSTIARINALRSGAETEREKSAATIDQLLAQANSTSRSGESEVASLEVRRDAAGRRGQATSRQMLAEAQALEDGQRAVVAQMRQEITSANQVLVAELNRLDQAAASFVAIARANFDEGTALASTFERITVANTAELAAAHIAARRQADADISHARTLAATNRELGAADVTRVLANAEAELGQRQAFDIATRGTIDAGRRVADAAAFEQLTVANADEQAVVARFNHRMVATQSERNRAYADQYLAGMQRNAQTTQFAADATAHGELANAALARLNTAARSFDRAAHQNWDSRLAFPGAMPTVTTNGDAFDRTNVSYPNSTIDLYEFDDNQNWVVVPTDGE